MNSKQIKLKLKRQLYLNTTDQADEFIKRLRGFIRTEARARDQVPDSILLADMIADILKDIRERDTDRTKHQVLKENRHECFKYYFEELVELIGLGYKSQRIQNHLMKKKKCKAPARGTIDKFIKSVEEHGELER